ncbi:MAG: hypothetical protein AAFV25_13215 [Bacteroidota bacterium]
MAFTIFLVAVSLIVFTSIVRIGISFLSGLFKAFEGLVAIVLMVFLFSMYSDPVGTGMWCRSIIGYVSDLGP